MIRLELSIAGALLLLCAAGPARADEPVGAREPHLMSETAEITSVVDAFDDDDPFDLNLVLGFTQSWKHAKIRRETQLNQPGLADGGFIPATENIASYSSSKSTLLVGADVGLYKDLALILRVPLILELVAVARRPGRVAGGRPDAARRSRSAGQHLLGPLHEPHAQRRRLHLRRHRLGDLQPAARRRRSRRGSSASRGAWRVGAPLHACNANAPDPSAPTLRLHATRATNRQPGISPAFDTIIGRTVWSRRFGYVEPYTGFSVEAQFPQARGDFGAYNAPNDLERMPPLLGSFMLGLEVVPYEHREQYQRLSADFRFKGTYQSPGRDYSELFDALGSSNAAVAAHPEPRRVHRPGGGTTSVADTNSESVYFTGHHRGAGVRQLHAVGVGDLAGRRVHQVHGRQRVHVRAAAPRDRRRHLHAQQHGHQPRPGPARAPDSRRARHAQPRPPRPHRPAGPPLLDR